MFINDTAALQASNFDRKNPTRIYAHGFTGNGQNHWSLRLRDRTHTKNFSPSESNQINLIIITGFLEKENCNFISVDWRHLAAGPDYPRAVANVQLVGSLAGSFVKFLVLKGADLRRVHLIGFSLGAHVVGKAGQTMNSEIPRITGTLLIVSWFRQI